MLLRERASVAVLRRLSHSPAQSAPAALDAGGKIVGPSASRLGQMPFDFRPGLFHSMREASP